jgi:hypothetical protein
VGTKVASSSSLVLDKSELEALTGYKIATKQLAVLQRRGFTRAFINRLGDLVLERAHYEAVCRGEVFAGGGKVADLSWMHGRK